ncbi:hypothetical protein C8R46DRAFT_1354995 [Mycena filopes]|nr:hypothetical protein C8R46DRAFT_1354995 [Mycena filopes]
MPGGISINNGPTDSFSNDDESAPRRQANAVAAPPPPTSRPAVWVPPPTFHPHHAASFARSPQPLAPSAGATAANLRPPAPHRRYSDVSPSPPALGWLARLLRACHSLKYTRHLHTRGPPSIQQILRLLDTDKAENQADVDLNRRVRDLNGDGRIVTMAQNTTQYTTQFKIPARSLHRQSDFYSRWQRLAAPVRRCRFDGLKRFNNPRAPVSLLKTRG